MDRRGGRGTNQFECLASSNKGLSPVGNLTVTIYNFIFSDQSISLEINGQEEEQINMNAWFLPIKPNVAGGHLTAAAYNFMFGDLSISLEHQGQAWRKRNKYI